MKAFSVHNDNRETFLNVAIDALKSGQLIIYPGKNGYLIGADINNPAAVERIFTSKGRPRHKQLTSMVTSLEMAKKYGIMNPSEEAFAEHFMPGKVILVLKKQDSLVETLGTVNKFAFTFPNYPVTSELISTFGQPITATSCNLAGEPIYTDVTQIDASILEHVEVVLDAGILPDVTRTRYTGQYS